MKQSTYASVLAVLAAGLCLLSGCRSSQPTVLGAAPAAAASATVKQLAAQRAGSVVTIEGEMTEKCPVAGCWFMLRDKTGIVRVDTKSAGFVVSQVPLHSRLTVSGTVSAGTEVGVAATGVRF